MKLILRVAVKLTLDTPWILLWLLTPYDSFPELIEGAAKTPAP
jgi:hypothetical protein